MDQGNIEVVNRVLFISIGIINNSWCLKQAIKFAEHNSAALDILIIYPKFPDKVSLYEKNYKKQCIDLTTKRVNLLLNELNLNNHLIDIEVIASDLPHIDIVNRVLNRNYHLVIKKADYNNKGILKALDMKLLRLTPCLVWLCKEINYKEHDINILVAIDSGSTNDTEKDLSLKLLQIAKQLSEVYKAKLHVISCYDTNFKSFIQDNNLVTDNSFIEYFTKEETSYHEKLKQLMKKISFDENITVVYCQGLPEIIIPTYVKDNKIDILVMGSVSKLGIEGHFIGNTAENIIQDINCSLVTKKPRGFIAPI